MLKKVDGVGAASVFQGDPRQTETGMDAWYQRFLFESGPAKARPHLYGADAGLCARRNVLLEHNVWMASEKSPTTAAYMAIGVALEDMLAKGLRRNDRLVTTQFKLPKMDEVYISGYVDLIIFDSEDKLAIVEVKTCGKLPEEASPVHLAQVQTYAAVTGIKRAWLTYISRNVRDEFGTKLAMRTFAVDVSDATLLSRLQTAAMSRLAGNIAKLPPVPAHFRKHTECHYCEFRDAFCWRSRPGLGADDPQPPLELLDTKAMMLLDIDSMELAKSMFSNTEVRYREVLETLLFSSKIHLLDNSITDRLVDLIRIEGELLIAV